jgi:hypothetical protein
MVSSLAHVERAELAGVAAADKQRRAALIRLQPPPPICWRTGSACVD